MTSPVVSGAQGDGGPVEWTCGACGRTTRDSHFYPDANGVMHHSADGCLSSFIHVVSSGLTEVDVEPLTVSPETQARLDEMNRVRDRGAAEGANYWIGGSRG